MEKISSFVEDLVVEKGLEKVRKDLFSRFPQLKDRKILFFAGRVAKEKNIPFLLPVLQRVNQLLEATSTESRQTAALLVAGDGNFMQELKELVAQHGLSQDVFFLGYVDRNDLSSLCLVGCVFTLPSM